MDCNPSLVTRYLTLILNINIKSHKREEIKLKDFSSRAAFRASIYNKPDNSFTERIRYKKYTLNIFYKTQTNICNNFKPHKLYVKMFK